MLESSLRPETFAIATFSSSAKGGFTPHVEQDGRGVWTLAVVASKVDGRVFGRPHTGQTQVAGVTLGNFDVVGLAPLIVDATNGEPGIGGVPERLVTLLYPSTFPVTNPLFCFGIRVILGEALRKPA